jgi:hypothetical protein
MRLLRPSLSKPVKAGLLALACAAACLGHSAGAQAPATPAPANPERFTGCVVRSAAEKDTLILNTETACARLTGSFPAANLAGHEVDLKGILTPRTPSTAASLHVDSVVSIGKACSDICSLQPPGTRGLGKGEKPGKEGGTPGETSTPDPAPPR